MYRTHTNGELRISDVGKEVTLVGWVSKKRNLGSLVFIDLRDRYGYTQVLLNEDFPIANEIRNEYIIQVKGIVSKKEGRCWNEHSNTSPAFYAIWLMALTTARIPARPMLELFPQPQNFLPSSSVIWM